MSIHVEFPVFVSSRRRSDGGKGLYEVTPLFSNTITGSGRTFERAIQACVKRTRNMFANSQIGRDNLEITQWMAFNPELTTHKLALDLSDGNRGRIPTDIMVVVFDVGDYRYACFPRLQHLMMMPRTLRWAEQIDHIQAEIYRWLRRQRRAMDPERLDLAPFAFQKGDFITTIRTTLAIKYGKFDFEPVFPPGMLASFLGLSKLNGADEVEQVALNLNERYPDDLQRARTPPAHLTDLTTALYGPRPMPTVIVGPSGVGRTTLLHEVIGQHLDAHRKTQTNMDRVQRIWHLDPTRIVSGMSLIGAWQRRTDAILSHLQNRLPKRHKISLADALFIDNPVALCRVGKTSGSNLTLSTLLRPYIEQRAFPIVLEATPEQWRRIEEMDRAFADLFQTIRLRTPHRNDSLQILIQHRNRLERRSGIQVKRAALRRIVELEERYPSPRSAPGSFIERLERVCDQSYGDVSEADVERVFQEKSGMRAEILDIRQPLTPEGLRARLSQRLIGQPEAVTALADTIHLTRAGVASPGRPAASLFLVGPTGVGKTEAAKVLVDTLYTTPESFIRLDMNEYVNADAARRLIGDIHRPEGQLTGQIRHRPFSVLLLDEIEKAHPSVHDLLLQVLDEGRLTDSMGRVSDFSQAIILLTSNVGAREVGKQAGFRADSAQEQAATYRGALRRAFRPEFLNRIDQIVVFGSLQQAHIERIAQLQLSRMLQREGLRRHATMLALTPAVLQHLAVTGFDPHLGARALKRTLEHTLVAPLASQLVQLHSDQPTMITIDAVDGKITFQADAIPFLQATTAQPFQQQYYSRPPEQRQHWQYTQIEAAIEMLDPGGQNVFVAKASPEGTHVPEEMYLLSELRQFRIRLLEKRLDEEDLPELQPSHSFSRVQPRSSKRHKKRRRWWYPPGSLLRELASTTVLRAALREVMDGPPEDSSYYYDDPYSDEGRLLLLLRRTRALHSVTHTNAVVYLRNLNHNTLHSPWQSIYNTLVNGWDSLLQEWNIQISVYCVTPQNEILPQARFRERHLPNSPTNTHSGLDLHDCEPNIEVMLHLQGAGAVELMSTEMGLHLFFPGNDAPHALQVLVAPVEPGPPPLQQLLTAWQTPSSETARPSVIRRYVLPDGLKDRGAVQDFRSNTLVEYRALESWLRNWIYQGLTGDLALEVSP